MRAPAAFASQGQISGTGLAQAKTTARGAIWLTQSGLITSGPGREKATHTSAPTSASATPPRRSSPLLSRQTCHLCRKRSRCSWRSRRCRFKMPWLSQAITLAGSTPAAHSNRYVAMLAAPIPTSVMRTSVSDLSTNASAFVSPASATTAVPCWSSCQTGMCARSRRRSRTSKHFGWAISSRLIPPKDGSMI